jgi:hypothetical protein
VRRICAESGEHRGFDHGLTRCGNELAEFIGLIVLIDCLYPRYTAIDAVDGLGTASRALPPMIGGLDIDPIPVIKCPSRNEHFAISDSFPPKTEVTCITVILALRKAGV